jgi:hypothetical protein
VATILALVGFTGLVDPLYAFPMVGLLLTFAVLAWLSGTDVLDDAPLLSGDHAATALSRPPAASDPPVPPMVDEPTPAPAAVPARATVARTFRLPASVGADEVWLVGDFNAWSHTAHPMVRDGDWFTISIELDPGRTYRYRYLLDGDRWENDWSAEAYTANEFGSDDSLVRT